MSLAKAFSGPADTPGKNIDYEILIGEIVWAVRNEIARNIDDFLARRTQLLILDARASIEVAPTVARIMAKELGYGRRWRKNQVKQYLELAKNYILD